MGIKKFIFSYDRPETISTHKHINDENTTILLHTDEMAEKYAEANPQIAHQLLATGQPKGLTNQRNFALGRLDEGEWALFLVDDIVKVTRTKWLYKQNTRRIPITFDNQKQFVPQMKLPMENQEFSDYCEVLIKLVAKRNCHLIGFTNYENPMFRGKRYSYNSHADGRAYLVRKTKLRFDPNAQMIDDVSWNALNLEAGYDIVVANWLLLESQMYTKGAYGTIEQRLAQKTKECEYLIERHPGIVQYADSKELPLGTHVKVKRRKLRDESLRLI